MRTLVSNGNESAAELLETKAWVRRLPGARGVEFRQTHLSLLFFVGERVFKVKKAVDLGFVDFTSLERRRHFCQEEVRLNRRLSPSMYLGVVPIVREPDGCLYVGGDGDVVDWAVEMVRLPAEGMLDQRLAAGRIDNADLARVVDVLVDFHASASTGPGVDVHGSSDTIRANALENFAQLAPLVASSGERRLLEFLEARTQAFLATNEALLAGRVLEGRIRDGHGDLHAGNVCLTKSDLAIYDCIEFADRFRCADVAADLAFLAMDLDHRGYPGFSGYLVRRYAAVAGDPGLLELLDFYKGYRAVVRAKVEAMTSVDPGIDEDTSEAQRRESLRHIALATSYELKPGLVLVCGLPGVGKSHLAARLRAPLRASVLGSGLERHVHPHREDAYRALLEEFVTSSGRGRTTIVDATFWSSEFRAPFLDAAARLGVPTSIVYVTAPEEVVRERLARRAGADTDRLETDLDAYLRARDAFEPPGWTAAEHVIEHASGQEEEETAASVLERWIEYAEGPVALSTSASEDEGR